MSLSLLAGHTDLQWKQGALETSPRGTLRSSPRYGGSWNISLTRLTLTITDSLQTKQATTIGETSHIHIQKCTFQQAKTKICVRTCHSKQTNKKTCTHTHTRKIQQNIERKSGRETERERRNNPKLEENKRKTTKIVLRLKINKTSNHNMNTNQRRLYFKAKTNRGKTIQHELFTTIYVYSKHAYLKVMFMHKGIASSWDQERAHTIHTHTESFYRLSVSLHV